MQDGRWQWIAFLNDNTEKHEPMLQKLIINICIAFAIIAPGQLFAQSVDYIVASKDVILNRKPNKYHLYKGYGFDTYVNFIGEVRSGKRDIKIVLVKTIWGPNKHTYAHIYIFDKMNRYLGEYRLGDASDLPESLKDGYLIFSNKEKNCSKIKYTKINLKHHLPIFMFIFACGELGDVYYFK